MKQQYNKTMTSAPSKDHVLEFSRQKGDKAMPSEPQDWDWDIVKSLKNNCADLKGDRHTQCMNNLSHAASVGLAHANATHHALNKEYRSYAGGKQSSK